MTRARSAFTLTEIIIVIVLLGILGALVVPRISRMVVQSRVQRAAQALQADVQQAFTVAGRNRQPVKLLWNSGAMQFRVTNRAETVVFRSTSLGENSGFGLGSDDVTVSRTSLQIFPNGLAEDTLRITLARDGYERTIRVSRAGIVRLQ